MRTTRVGLPRLCLILFIFILVPSISGQQNAADVLSQLAPRDPQAVNVLNQALAAAGGAAALNAITDYVATGTVTSDQGQPVQETVTISGRGPTELRKDVSQSTGTQSSVIRGVVSYSGDSTGYVETHTTQPPMMAGNFAMPYREMAIVLTNNQFGLTYIGLVQSGSQSLHDVRAQFLPLWRRANSMYTVDFFIDSSTLQLSIVQDAVPRRAIPRTITYSAFRTVAGVLAPFQILESIGGQAGLVMQLSQISFNVGLQDSMFQLGSAAVVP